MNSSTHQQSAQTQPNRIEILEKQGINPYPYQYERSCSLWDVQLDYHYVDKRGEEVLLKLCGRVMNIHPVGKLLYVTLHDSNKELQFFLGLNTLPAEDIQRFNQFIVRGDWIGFTVNRLYRTSTGELTAQVKSWSLLAPCLLRLPHPIKNPQRQRQQRALHLASDLTARMKFIARSKTLHHMRRFLEEEYGFREVNTPAIQSSIGTENDSRFEIAADDGMTKACLRISPKPYLKQLIIGGLDAVYEICDSYRNERIDWLHYPESQTMECCLSPADIEDMIELTERLFIQLVMEHHPTLRLTWYSREQLQWSAQHRDDLDIGDDSIASSAIINDTIVLDFNLPWQRRSVFSLVQEVTGTDFLSLTSVDEAAEVARSVGIDIGYQHTYASVHAIALRIMDELVVPTLIQPTFVVDLPFDECSWAKRNRYDARLTESFELIINGIRFATACTEQNDPRQQAAQFREDSERHGVGNDAEEQPNDDYLRALSYGLPPTAGLRIDVDRLVMLLTSSADLRDVIYFPIYKNHPSKR